MKKIALVLPETSYSPEIYALHEYLNKYSSYSSSVLSYEDFITHQQNFSLVFLKMGFIPFWKSEIKIPQIHDYASLSTGRYSFIKDLIKSRLSKKPVLRSFLNYHVKNRMNFMDEVPYIYRDMGADEFFFMSNKSTKEKKYDFCYVGSITDDREVGKILDNFIDSNYNIVLVGEVKITNKEKYENCNNIIFLGKKNRVSTAEIIKSSKIGFNYMPDIHPWNMQTSTKIIEYLASEIMVVTNAYNWTLNFSDSSSLYFYSDIEDVDLDEIHLFYTNEFKPLSASKLRKYSWSNIFDKSKILDHISFEIEKNKN